MDWASFFTGLTGLLVVVLPLVFNLYMKLKKTEKQRDTVIEGVELSKDPEIKKQIYTTSKNQGVEDSLQSHVERVTKRMEK